MTNKNYQANPDNINHSLRYSCVKCTLVGNSQITLSLGTHLMR